MPTRRWFHPPAALALACLATPAIAATPGQPAVEPAYHGGALLVTDPRLAQGHLTAGQVLPIRLSRLASQAGPGTPPLGGFEVPNSIRYGQLRFLAVSPACVTFSVAFHDAGAPGPPRTFTLHQGERADLTGDGLSDLVLEPPVKALAAGASAIDYALLAFPCDGAHTAMFALAPGIFAGAVYPYGISGVTPAGQFIFQSDCLPIRGAGGAGLLALAGTGPEPMVEPGPGDVLVQARSGTFSRIERVRRTREGLLLQCAPAGTPDLFQEVFGAACVHLSGNLAELRRRYRCGPAQSGPEAAGGVDLVAIAVTEHLLDGGYGKLDLQVAARLGAELALSASINAGGISASLAVHLDESLRLATNFHAGRPWSQKFGPIQLTDPELGFAVYGVPMSLSLDLSAGLDLDDQDTGSALEGLDAEGRWGWSGAFSARWSWHGVEVNAPAPEVIDTLVVRGLPENRSNMNGKASVRPWLTITPKLGFASFLYGECVNTLAIEDSFEDTSHGGRAAIHTQEDASYQLQAGFSLEPPVLGKIWERLWPLRTWADTLWAEDRVRSAAAKAP